jgi:hypothetical protein
LQHVVLHHVAQRARAVIEAHAAFKAHGFGHGDLHMFDMRGVPQRLEHDVGKAQRQKVLDRFLAQIVVDAEDAVFGEGARHGIVDHLGGGQIGAQRLFKADAALLIGQAAVDEARDGRLEQAGRGGQEDRQTLHRRRPFGQRVEMGRVIGVERLVEQAFQEALDGGLAMLGQELVQRLRGKVAEDVSSISERAVQTIFSFSGTSGRRAARRARAAASAVPDRRLHRTATGGQR